MKKAKIFYKSFFESFLYALFGVLFAGAYFAIEDYLWSTETNGFAIDYVQETVGLLWVFLGLLISAVFWNFLFRKATKHFFTKWSLVLFTSAIISVLMQIIFLISNHDMTLKEIIHAYFPHNISYLLGISRMINLFKVLAPFTILFTVFLFLFERRQNQNLLK